MASNTRRRKTKLDSSLSEEKLLKENKYFDLSFDDLKDVKFNFVDTKMSEKMQIQQTEENLEQHIEEILNDFMSGIVCCWNNCSGYSKEKCFKCNLVFPKLSRLKKRQRVKGF